MESPANTLEYMIAGFTVIFSFIAVYIASLIIRSRKYQNEEILLDEVKAQKKKA